MEELAFDNLLAVCVIALGAPLLLGLVPGLRLPAVVLELVAGIVVGPAGLGWVEADTTVLVLATLGLAMLLFLAGLEVDLSRLRGPLLRLAASGFALSFALALLVGLGLQGAGLVSSPVFVAVALSATSLGVVVPALKDAGLAGSSLGQLVIAAASIADVATIVLLSLLFSRDGAGTGATLVLLGCLAVAAIAVALAVRAGGRWHRLGSAVLRLQDTTAQIRVRAAMTLVVGFAALAMALGLEVILGAFIAGLLLGVIDRDEQMTHPLLRVKLEGLGFGLLIPVFFVTSGLRFDLDALLAGGSVAALVPLFLAALLIVRGAPALLARDRLDGRREVAATGLLQATSLPFIVAATQIGVEIGAVGSGTASALVAAGLVSVLCFPLLALTLLSPQPEESSCPSPPSSRTSSTSRPTRPPTATTT